MLILMKYIPITCSPTHTCTCMYFRKIRDSTTGARFSDSEFPKTKVIKISNLKLTNLKIYSVNIFIPYIPETFYFLCAINLPLSYSSAAMKTTNGIANSLKWIKTKHWAACCLLWNMQISLWYRDRSSIVG